MNLLVFFLLNVLPWALLVSGCCMIVYGVYQDIWGEKRPVSFYATATACAVLAFAIFTFRGLS